MYNEEDTLFHFRNQFSQENCKFVYGYAIFAKEKKLWFNFFLSCGKDSCFLWCINGVHGKLLSEWSRDSSGRLAVLTHLWSRWIQRGPGASYCAFICKIWELIFNSFQLQTFFIIVEGNCFLYRLKTLVTFV